MVRKNIVVIGSGVMLFVIGISAFVLFSTTPIENDITVKEDIKITVDTKHNHYTNGETVNIWGQVTDSDKRPLSEYNHVITIQILFGESLKETAQITPLQNGTFHYSIDTNTNSWENGQYTLKVFYDDNMAMKSFNLNSSNPSKIIPTQIENFEQMNCEELVEVNSSGKTIESKDTREFVRQKVNHCQSLQEQSIWYGECSTTLIIANHNFKPLTDNIEWLLQSTLDRCVNNGNLELIDLPISNQHKFCEDANKHEICGEIPVNSQLFKETTHWDELYQKALENEKNFFSNVDCTALFDAYDGKMHTIGWDGKKDVILDRFDECKENES